MEFVYIITGLLFALIVSLLMLPRVIEWVKERNFVDNPNQRSAHQVPTPTMGGIAIFAAILLPFMALIFKDLIFIPLVLAFITVFATGVIDDLKELSPIKKMSGQFVAALLLAVAGFRITSLYGVFGVDSIPVVVQYVITIVAVIGITNAFNLIDGVDGLTGGIVLINALIFGGVFIAMEDWFFAFICFSMVGAYVGFLVYNFYPAKIFMGDSGSLVAGFLMAMMALRMLSFDFSDHLMSIDSERIALFVVGLLFLPIFDFVRVVLFRIKNGQHPMKADKNHAHHLLLNEGLNHKRTSITLYIIHIFLLVISLLVNVFPFYWALALLFVSGYALVELFDIRQYKKVKKELNSYQEQVQKRMMTNQLLWKNQH